MEEFNKASKNEVFALTWPPSLHEEKEKKTNKIKHEKEHQLFISYFSLVPHTTSWKVNSVVITQFLS